MIQGEIKDVRKVGNDRCIMLLAPSDGSPEIKYFIDGGGDIINEEYKHFLRFCMRREHGSRAMRFECNPTDDGSFEDFRLDGREFIGFGNISVAREFKATA